LEGLKPQEEVIEDKIKDILERCDEQKKKLFLRIIAEIAKLE
jgi:hypothetical protein